MLSKLHVAIEGAVAVGKSTLLPKLHEVFLAELPNIKMDLVPEPVDRWVDWKGTNPEGSSWNLLELMYQNPEENAARFQIAAAISKIQSLNDSPGPAKIVERTLLCQEKVFIPLLIKNGFLSGLDQSILEQFFHMTRSMTGLKADVIIYLRTSPEIAMTRIQSRNRTGEQNITLEYLTNLHELYDDWLIYKREERNVVVIAIDDFDKVSPENIFARVMAHLEK